MRDRKKISVIIPAYNEQDSVGLVLKGIPSALIDEVVLVNNASTDKTAEVAKQAGATVLMENQKGYGKACLKGIDYLNGKTDKPEIVVFLDADYSDHPEELSNLIKPIIENGFDMVLGSRSLGERERGSMTPQQVFGNWLACLLMKWLFDSRFTDLGPFRAIKYEKLVELNMRDEDFGWTVEMQVKAIKKGYKYTEVPVSYRKRIGVSKVSGTIYGTVMAGYKIITTIFKYWK